jgi:phi13 family phage major tail protein
MAVNDNKVQFGLKNVHYAKILGWSTSSTTGISTPNYADPVSIPGAVNFSADPNGENENFYADNGVYYVINNNAGYSVELEIAIIPQSFAIDILGEKLDDKGVLVERSDAETSEFALFWEFDGDKNHTRYVAYRCAASRPGMNGSTTEDSKTPQTDTLSMQMMALPTGEVKSKTVASTNAEVYNNWYTGVHMPETTTDP